MNAIEILLLNMNEVRRRSEIVWESIDKEYYDFKPDGKALTIFEMIKHVLESEYYYLEMFKVGRSIGQVKTPYQQDFDSIAEMISFSKYYRKEYEEFIVKLSETELSERKIDRMDVGYIRSIGDMIERVTFHEAVHLGQLLDYMRTAGIDRPNIWD